MVRCLAQPDSGGREALSCLNLVSQTLVTPKGSLMTSEKQIRSEMGGSGKTGETEGGVTGVGM